MIEVDGHEKRKIHQMTVHFLSDHPYWVYQTTITKVHKCIDNHMFFMQFLFYRLPIAAFFLNLQNNYQSF